MTMKNLNKTPQEINRSLGQRIKGADRAIAKRYAILLNEIRSDVALLYEKYEEGGILTYEEMSRYDRLDKFIGDINNLLKANYKDIKDTIYDVLGESYKDGYYLTAWAVETDTLSKLDYSAVKPETITKAIENPISGLKLNHRLEKSRSEVVYKIQQEVTQGLVKGETYGTMSKRIKETLEDDATKSMAVVRTEGHRIVEESKHDSAAHATKNGIIMTKEWNTLEDGRVRNGRKTPSNHVQLNGVKKTMDEDFNDGLGEGPAPGQLGAAGSDINCRCFLTYAIDRIEKPDAQELEDMTFETWKEERIRGEE